ncbi:methionyl-tRNA formyltransferase [Candidatus Nomurabacteria bacterium]|nr:methionyl-tRNA formyltransferase [Candidatus Nomurabacteria bacterium]
MNKINFIFWGTPDVASETLEILKQAGFLPSFIVTSPDAKKGRGLQMQASPVAIFAQKNNIPCLKPEKLEGGKRPNLFEFLRFDLEEPIDLFVVVAYGKIMPEKIINSPKLGSINIHYSLLPKYRGASPVESAILNGDKVTGVTIQKMELALDSGPIIAQEKTEISPDEKAPDLRERLIKIGGELLVKILPEYAAGKIKPAPQNGSFASVCRKIKKEDGLINLDDDAVKNYNKFRAYAVWPRTFFFKNNKRIIITDAELVNGEFVIKKVLPEGKKEIKWQDFNLRYSVD